MSVRFQPAFRYSARNMAKGTGVFLLVMVLVQIFFGVSFSVAGAAEHGNFTGFGLSAAVFMLVMGIVCVREDLRLFAQHGVTRRTGFCTELAALAAAAAMVALTGEVLTGAMQVLAGGERFFTGDLYQIFYLDGWGKNGMTLSQHGGSFLFNLGLLMVLGLVGQFFSLLFWRLNKFWTVVAAVGIPVAVNVVPWVLVWLGLGDAMARAALGVLGFLGGSLWNFLAAAIASGAALTAVNWLLLRRLNIRAAK